MSLWSRLWERARNLLGGARRRSARAAGAEADAPGDPHTAYSRATGGVADPDQPDQHSTTGTTPSGEYVGRASGDDPGAVGTTGAEARGATPSAGSAERPARRRIVVPRSRRS